MTKKVSSCSAGVRRFTRKKALSFRAKHELHEMKLMRSRGTCFCSHLADPRTLCELPRTNIAVKNNCKSSTPYFSSAIRPRPCRRRIPNSLRVIALSFTNSNTLDRPCRIPESQSISLLARRHGSAPRFPLPPQMKHEQTSPRSAR